jgi:DNA-binding CsgD family transcriptional regulator
VPNHAAFERVLANAYDLALGAASWSQLLSNLGESLGCHFVGAVATTPNRMTSQSLAVTGIDAVDHSNFLRTWHRRNVYGVRRPIATSGTVVEARSIVPKDELLKTEIYNAYLAPRGIEEALRIDILHQPTQSQAISLARRWSTNGFSADELAFAHAVAPHLQRAVTLKHRLRQTHLLGESALAALDSLQSGCLLISATGVVVHANQTAEALLRAADGIAAAGPGLCAASPTATARLHALLRRAAANPPVAGALRLPRPSGQPPLSLIAMPLPRAHEILPRAAPSVLLHVSDPLAAQGVDAAVLMALFDFTVAEADLAARLSTGQSMIEVAKATGRSLPTLRTHLANLTGKTGTPRQVDLARLLARLPGALPPR